jgi:hypothetical protein
VGWDVLQGLEYPEGYESGYSTVAFFDESHLHTCLCQRSPPGHLPPLNLMSQPRQQKAEKKESARTRAWDEEKKMKRKKG